MPANKKPYDVGVVGYWWSTNYGSVATYYALYKEIEEAGLRPVFIDRPDSASGGEGMNVFSRRFMQKYAGVSPSFGWNETQSYNELCNTFVIGSDQVWTSTSINIYNYFFFLDFVSDENNKIAYASSFGETFQVGEEANQKAGSCLKRFSRISVREFQAVDICREKLGVKAEWVMDPVFLLNKKHWTALADHAERKADAILGKDQKYLLAYILNPSDEKREIVHEVAKQTGLPVICILDGRKGTFEKNAELFPMENTIENTTEEEWLWFFEHADYIVTDSQHGSAFSILLNKQFICCSNKKWGQSRFVSLFGLLGLRDRQQVTLREVQETRLWEKPIDYQAVNKILDARVKASKEWLQNALIQKRERVNTTTVRRVAKEDRCSGCGACAQVCPKGAIVMKQNEKGFFNPEVSDEVCILCGLCLKKCIHEHPSYENEKNPVCYAMMAKDEVRAVSSSGGMFTVAAEYVLDQGGYVCGAAYRDDFSVAHMIVSNKEDLEKLRGSKYLQSDVGSTYAEIKRLLQNDKMVLFTGLPCQVAGLNAFLGKKYEKLYTIDLLCHGVSSYKVLRKYHHDVLGGKKLSKLLFRAKKPWGWRTGMNAFFDDGTTYSELSKSDPYLTAYLKGISGNHGCRSCTSNHLPRQSDITMGDFWGIAQNDPSMHDKKGTSVVLVNTPAGEKLFEQLKPMMKKWKKEPLSAAVSKNQIIKKPFTPHQNQAAFFAHFDELDFAALVKGCTNNRLYDEQKMELLKTVPESKLELYTLAKTAAKKSCGRKIVTLEKSSDFAKILQTYFGLTVAFSVSQADDEVDNEKVFPLEKLQNRSASYYLVSVNTPYSAALDQQLREYGFTVGDDFLFRNHEPLVLKNHSLANGYYEDIYGNTIEGFSGVIPELILRGCNNHLIVGEGVYHTDNLRFDLTGNSYIRIGEKCNFTKPVKVEVKGLSGNSKLVIGARCKFMKTNIRLYNHSNTTSILLGEDSTLGNETELCAGFGNRVMVGRDCMLADHVNLQAGNGYTVFDVNTGKSINSGFGQPHEQNQLVLGEHVWIGKGAFLMHGAHIGSGSMVEANSVVKGVYPNNCSVAGNPAGLIRKDIAWSRKMNATDPADCGRKEYYTHTKDAAAPIAGRSVLVLLDGNSIGKWLVRELISLENQVTIAGSGLKKDEFGVDVSRLSVDVSNLENTKRILGGQHYDVVFDLLAACSQNVDHLLSGVSCDRYVQLSTVQVYEKLSPELRERAFDPTSIPLKMCSVKEVPYVESKRQAEAVTYQKYGNIPAVTVRVPYVIPASQLEVYCSDIQKAVPLHIKDLDRMLSFVRAFDIGRFLPWIAAQDYCGPINFSAVGTVTVGEILRYLEQKTGRKAILSEDSSLPREPFQKFHENSYSMNLEQLTSLGYKPSELKAWFWSELNLCLEKTKN